MSTLSDAVGAILLAGGRATRLDGRAKPLLEIGGRSLLAAAIAGARDAGARPITVVAPVLEERTDVDWVREDPPFAGPAAATVAALRAWDATGEIPAWTLLLACDLPRADEAVARLTADAALLGTDSDGLCLGDRTGRPQWLTGLYRTDALRESAYAVPDAARDAPVRALFDDRAITVITDLQGLTDDVDTWEDLHRARALADRPEEAS
ncbi:molybdenum cofactor guanylyltransferase [Microbacterium hominis]|uniref:molybdenum cofactor guanylyltransferase n=1 Tax=Microbacterium hominis TaxID=162426 RepID=UPI0020B89F71|nr:NTP transferase domain-containing protein [Microbacterium hominis]